MIVAAGLAVHVEMPQNETPTGLAQSAIKSTTVTLPQGLELAHAERLLATFQANQTAARLYRPSPYPGVLTLFRAAGSLRPGRDPALGWGRLAATVELHEVPGEHEDLIDPPHVAVLAGRLRVCFANR